MSSVTTLQMLDEFTQRTELNVR